MKDTRVMFLIFAFSLLLYAGCATRPTELIQQTERAREEAKEAYADQFALEDWSAAEKAWGQAEDALAKEDYGQASTFLLRAKERYGKARDLASGKKEMALKEIESNKTGASIRLKNLVESAAKLPAARRKQLEARAKEIEGKLAQVDEHIKKGEFNDAKVLAARTFREVWELEQEFKK